MHITFLFILKILIALFLIRHGIHYVVRNSSDYQQMLKLLMVVDREIKNLLQQVSFYVVRECLPVSVEDKFDSEDKEIIEIISKINKNSLLTKAFFLHPGYYLIVRLFNPGKSNVEILNKLFVKRINRLHYLLLSQHKKHTLLLK